MYRKFLAVLLLMIAALTLILTACEPDPKDCAHKYETEWSHDRLFHFHKCEYCGSQTDKEAHFYDKNGVCKKCGYENETVMIPGEE